MKMIDMSGTNIKGILLVLLTLLLAGCNRNRNNPGWDYFPDMFYSTAYETFSENPVFENGMTMRLPVAGTVPRGFIPFNYTIDAESRIKAGKELVNPIVPGAEVLVRGRELYTGFCIGCHGIKGEGDGNLYTSGLYPVKPRSLMSGTAYGLKDGEIFHSITLGFGSMGPHGSQIKPDDRWRIVIFIRNMQDESRRTSGAGEGANK
jgi:mono/diheme cytochrome c family protein